MSFYSCIELTSIHFHRGPFLVGKIFINTRVLRDYSLVGIPLIGVSRGAQDVSLYTHVWRPSKAMSDPSKVYLSPSASFHQFLISSAFWSSHLRRSRRPEGGTVSFMILLFMSMNAQARSTGSLRPLSLPYMNEFIKISELPLSKTNTLRIELQSNTHGTNQSATYI